MKADVGYIALLVVLVVMPAVAIVLAVIDHMISRRRRQGISQAPSAEHAFPVLNVHRPPPSEL